MPDLSFPGHLIAQETQLPSAQRAQQPFRSTMQSWLGLFPLVLTLLQHKKQAGLHSSGRRWSDPYPSGKTLPFNTQKALWKGDCCHPHTSYSAEPFWDSRGSGKSEPNSLGIISWAEPEMAAKEKRKLFSKEYRKFYCGQSY